MATITLEAKIRENLGSSVARRERKAGRVPGVVYGHGGESVAVSVDALEFNRVLNSETGSNTLITLGINGKKDTALARQIHRHPTRPMIVHVDFIRVNMNEEVEANVANIKRPFESTMPSLRQNVVKCDRSAANWSVSPCQR